MEQNAHPPSDVITSHSPDIATTQLLQNDFCSLTGCIRPFESHQCL